MKETDWEDMYASSASNVQVLRLREDAILPTRAHSHDAGADLYSAEDGFLFGLHTAIVGTGIALAIPPGYVGLVHPRSGLAAKYGITVLNTPGTIDSDYRGEVKVILHNTSKVGFHVRKGDRIAQLVIQKVELPKFTEVELLEDTERSVSGFGSTGR